MGFAITDEILDGIFAEEDIVRERTRNPSKSEEIRSFVRSFHSNFLRYCNTKFSSLHHHSLLSLECLPGVAQHNPNLHHCHYSVSAGPDYKWGIATTTN